MSKHFILLVEDHYELASTLCEFLEEHDFSEEEISGVMSMISLGFHEKIIKRMRALANAENFVKDFVLQKNMTMQNVEKLLGFADHEIKDITEMLNRIHTTESMMREILQMLSIMKWSRRCGSETVC